MKRGKSAAFDEDDYYDDDGYDDDYGYGEEEEEEDYYDEGDYHQQHKKSSGTKQAPPPKFQPVTSSVVTTSSPVPKNKPAFPLATSTSESDDYSTAADKEIIDSMLPILRSSMLAAGMKAINFKQAQLVEALRQSNYDMDATVTYLKTNNNSNSNTGSAIPSSVSSPTTAGKAKVLTIGGSSKKNHVHDIPARHNNNSKNDDDDDQQQQQQQKKDTNTPAASPSPSSTRKMPKCELSEVKNSSGKTQISIVFAGHVDHGKSTTVGHLLYQLGQFTDREVQKMEQAAKRAGKGTFHFAWLLDQSDEERRRGVTIDSGIHSFETDHHTVSILDAPGHEQFIENMASSSAQADIAVLILSGQPGELAVGIEHNTRKHVQILKRIGISRLIVAINKMDSVDYAEEAFRDAEKKVLELLKEMKFDVEKEVVAVLPISGLAGVNLTERPTEKSCPALAKWYNNNSSPCLLEVIDKLDPVGRMHKFPFRFVVSDNNGKSVLSGKIQCGSVSVGDSLLFLPSNCKINVRSIDHSVTGPVKSAVAGDTVEIISSSDITPISVGDIGCQAKATSSNPHCLVGTAFEATIQTYGQHARAILPGHSFVLMINGVQVQAKIRKLLQKMDMNTGNWSVRGGIVKMIPKDVQGRVLIEVLEHTIPFERASDCMPLGKFLMKQEMNIVGGGVIEELVPNIGELLPKPVTGAPGQQ